MMKKLKDNFLAIALTCVIVLLFSVVLINQAKAEHFNLGDYARKCYNDNDAKEWKQAAESCKMLLLMEEMLKVNLIYTKCMLRAKV